MANLDPVEIEINMRQNVSEESDRASRGMDNMTHASKTLKEQIEIQRKTITDLEKQYAQANKSLADLSNQYSSNHTFSDKEITELTRKYNEAKKLIDEAKSALDREKTALTELEKEQNKVNKAQEKASNTSVSYMTQMRKIRQEMQELTMAGKGESIRYRELEAELARVGTAYNRVRTEQRLLTTAGNAHLAGLMQGMTGMAGAFSAGQGAASLFVKNNEQLAAIQTKLQAAMAITMGLQQVSNTLHATSAFRINTVTKMTQLWRNAQVVLNKHLGLSLALSKGLMLGGIGLLIAGVVVLISRMKEYNKEQKEFQKLNRDANASIQEQVSKVQVLERVLKDSNRSYSERENALKQLKTIMPEYNAMLDKEGRLIEDNTGALKRYVKELLNVELAKSVLKKLADAEIAMREFKDGLTDLDKSLLASPAEGEWMEHNGKKYKTNGDNDRTKRIRDQNDKFQKEIDRYTKLAEEYVVSDTSVSKDGTKAFYEQKQKNAQALLESMTDLEKGSDKWKTAVKDYNDATLKLKTWDIKGQNKSAESGAKKEAKDAEKLKVKQQKANEDFAKKTIEYQTKLDASRIAAMKEGSEKVRAEIQAEYDKDKALIAQELKEIEKLEAITGKPATGQRNQLMQLNSAVTAEYEAKIKALNEASQKAIQEIFEGVNQKFRSELDNNLEQIKKYYDEQIKKAKESGVTIEQIDLLNASRKKELAQAESQNQLKALAFETEIATRRLALSKDFYVFESDRIKKQLELQKKSKQDQLKILEQQYKETPTPELANEVTDATLAIAEMEKGIKKLSGQKFQEIAGYVSQIGSGLSDLFGADSSAGKVLGWTADFAEAGAKIASGDPKAMIEGTLQAAGTIKDIIKTNSQANKEIREFAYELEQAALNYSIAIISAIKDLESIADSIFYTDTSNTLTQGMEGYNAAIEKEIDLVSKLGDTTVEVGKKKKKFLGVTTGTKTIWENILTGYKKILDTDDELIDKNGQINKQIAESLLNSGKLSKEATNLINQILDAQDAAASAMAQVESTLETLAGSIGNDLKTSLIDAFQDGGAIGAAEKFKESVAKTLEDIVTDKMFSAIYGEMLGELEERMKNSYGSGGDQDLVDDIMWFYKQSQEGANAFYEQLNKAKEQLKEQGFEIADTEREGASKGIATASQDSISELNGGVYALRQSVNTLVNLKKEALLIQKTQSATLDQIAKNSEHLRVLPNIKNELEDLNNRGLKIR